jgi:hypothetical protein
MLCFFASARVELQAGCQQTQTIHSHKNFPRLFKWTITDKQPKEELVQVVVGIACSSKRNITEARHEFRMQKFNVN